MQKMRVLGALFALANSVGVSNGQRIDNFIQAQCRAAVTQNLCNRAFGDDPFCLWDQRSQTCSAPSLLGAANFCADQCGSETVSIFSNMEACSCANTCLTEGTCCPGFEIACPTTTQSPVVSTTMAPSKSPSLSPSRMPTSQPSEPLQPIFDSCLCHPNEPGCYSDARIGNWTACGTFTSRILPSDSVNSMRRCYCDNACSSWRCCSDYESLCVTSSPTSIPSTPPTGVPTEAPTNSPSTLPPTAMPTTLLPTAAPTSAPSAIPTTLSPTKSPTTQKDTCACTDNGPNCVDREHNGLTYCGTRSSRLTSNYTHCYCDAACMEFGNCCLDYESLCLTSSPTFAPSKSSPTNSPSPAPTPLFNTCRCDGPEYNPYCNNVLPPTTNYTLCGTREPVLRLSGGLCYCTSACEAAGNCCDDYRDLCIITTTTTTISSTTSTSMTSTTSTSSTTREKFRVPLYIQPPLPAFMSNQRQELARASLEGMLYRFGQPSAIRSVHFQNGLRRQVHGPDEALVTFWDVTVAIRVRDAGCVCDRQMVFEFENGTYFVGVQEDHWQYLPAPERTCFSSCEPTTTSTTETVTTSTSSSTLSSTTSTFTSTSTTTSTTSSSTTDTTSTLSSTTISTVTSTTHSTTTETSSSTTTSVTTSTMSTITTPDPCKSIMCAMQCNGSCGWHVIVGHPNEGLCETGFVTTDATRTLGCIVSNTDFESPISSALEDDNTSSFDEAWIYLIIVFALIVVALAYIVRQGRSQKKSAHNITTQINDYYNENQTSISPIPDHVHEQAIPVTSTPSSPTPVVTEERLQEEARVREESRKAREQIMNLVSDTRTAQKLPMVRLETIGSSSTDEPTNPVQSLRVRAKPRLPENELPLWYHSELSLEEAKAKIERTGTKNGRFLVRKNDDAYALNVASRGIVRDFKIVSDANDFIVLYDEIGNTVGSTFDDLPELVAALSSDILPHGWKIRLKEAVDKSTGNFVHIDNGILTTALEPSLRQGSTTDATNENIVSVTPSKSENGYLAVDPPEEKSFDPYDSSTWLHGVTKGKDAAFAKMGDSGETGVFMIERHKTPGWYIINVNYDKRQTRHLVTKDSDNVLLITKRRYGTHTTIEGLVDALSNEKPPNNWPVKLTKPILVDAKQSPQNSEPPNTVDVVTLDRLRTKSDATDLGQESSYLHGKTINKDTTFALIRDYDPSFPQGLFMVEHEHRRGRYVLNVCFKGKPTRHLIAPNENGILTINNKVYGEHKTLKSLIMALSSANLPRGWPVRLSRAIPPSLSTSSSKPISAAQSQAPIAESPQATQDKNSKWVHSERFDKAAGKEWATGLAGTALNGRFIIRDQNAAGGKYVLSVVYKNRMTEHLVAISQDGICTINGKQYGKMPTVNDVVTQLSTLPMPLDQNGKAWPAPLIEGRDAQTGNWVSMSGYSESSATSSSAVTVDNADTSPPWLHKVVNGVELSRTEATDIIQPNVKPAGTFVIREHIPDQDGAEEYVLSVNFKGRDTHHLIRKVDGSLVINGKGYGRSWRTIHELVQDLSQPNGLRPEGWPVQLKL